MKLADATQSTSQHLDSIESLSMNSASKKPSSFHMASSQTLQKLSLQLDEVFKNEKRGLEDILVDSSLQKRLDKPFNKQSERFIESEESDEEKSPVMKLSQIVKAIPDLECRSLM